jgi:hypothetical protein
MLLRCIHGHNRISCVSFSYLVQVIASSLLLVVVIVTASAKCLARFRNIGSCSLVGSSNSRNLTLLSAYFRMGHCKHIIGPRQSCSTCVTVVLICNISSNPMAVTGDAKISTLGDYSADIKEQNNFPSRTLKPTLMLHIYIYISFILNVWCNLKISHRRQFC